MTSAPCPCGAEAAYAEHCRPLHHGRTDAQTPEALMRSRYAAYALGELDYVWRTWHPRTRPDEVRAVPGLVWTGLQILEVPDIGRDEVEFVAEWVRDGVAGRLHERSRFERRGGRWLYVDGTLAETPTT